MTVSPVSNVNSVYQQQQVQSHAPASKPKAAAEQPADTVHLSKAAAAHLKKGADTDGDGDGR
ncbi:MAG TPA: hypothetical protein VEU96_15355 [Bryobacteraceae bacterium]|nr:hypothetical protein [Bryobacteraceae bacterium]